VFVGLLLVWLGINLEGPRRLLRRLPDRDHARLHVRPDCAGLHLVYGILELINFAHGDVFMLGGMFAITYATSIFGLKEGQGAVTVLIVLGTMVLAMATCGALNTVIELVAYKPLRHAPRLAPLITAIGVSFIIEDVGLAWKGPNYVPAPDVFPHTTRSRSARSTWSGTS
jgi:Branched-chain amino acid ABC-type transport system, permease components